MNDKQEQPVSMEPVAWGIVASNTGRICQVELDADEVAEHNPKYIVPLYTAQLAAARQQGADEHLKEWAMQALVEQTQWIEAIERIADLEKSNAKLLEALKAAYTMAVDQDNSKPVDWALYCEFLYQSIKAAEVKP